MQVGHKGAWLKRIGRGFRMEEGLQGAGGAYKGRGQMGDGRGFRMRMVLKGGRGFTIEAGHQWAGLKGAGFEGWRSPSPGQSHIWGHRSYRPGASPKALG